LFARPEGEWEKERLVIIREIAMGRDDPNRVISKLLWQTAFTVHPYRFPVIGYETLFRRMAQADLSGFFKQNYIPDNTLTVIVGNIDPEEVKTELERAFSGFDRQSRAPVILPREPPQLAPRFERRTGPYNVSRLEWAYHTVPLSHPDSVALDVLARIAGDGRSSRLVHELKEERKLVHHISTWSYTPKEPGLFGVSATFAPNNETILIDALQNSIESLCNAEFSLEEVNKAKRMLLNAELSDLQTMKGQASSFAWRKYSPKRHPTWHTHSGFPLPKALRDPSSSRRV